MDKKIFLGSFSEKRLQEKILSIIKDLPNPYPPDIFTWDNQEQITDARGKYNKMFYTIVENTKDDIVKALVEEELEHHAKEVVVDNAFEEKIKNESLREVQKEDKMIWEEIEKKNLDAKDWEEFEQKYYGALIQRAIEKVFQKLKEELK